MARDFLPHRPSSDADILPASRCLLQVLKFVQARDSTERRRYPNPNDKRCVQRMKEFSFGNKELASRLN
jgi:hypothetical protein